jgi:hypothetical protein
VPFSTQGFYNVVRPNNAPDWNLRLQGTSKNDAFGMKLGM